MKLINNSTRGYMAYDIILEPGKILEIEDSNIVDILKKQPGVEEYVSKEDIIKLKKELKELKDKQKENKQKENKQKENRQEENKQEENK